MSTPPLPAPVPAHPLPHRVSPWRLKLDHSALPPQYKTPDMTVVIEVTLSRTDLHLALIWLQMVETYVLPDAFGVLFPATLSQVFIDVYGARRLEGDDADDTVDLDDHWTDGFYTVWPEIMDQPYSDTELIKQLRCRGLVPPGLGLRVLQGVEHQITQLDEADQLSFPTYLHEWTETFNQPEHGDTLEGWIHMLRDEKSILEPWDGFSET